jgi:hypothetical protein
MTSIQLNLIYDYLIPDLLNFKNIELNKVQTASSLTFLRGERFISGYDCKVELIKLMNKFFGDLSVLTETGLIKQYQKLKTKTENEKLISMIIAGLNYDDILINNYTDNNYNTIKLTVSGICRVLLREHFTVDEIEEYCRNSPGFKIYFNS